MLKQFLCFGITFSYKMANIELVKDGDDLWAVQYAYKLPFTPDIAKSKWKLDPTSFTYKHLTNRMK
ncbi:hypothetical protein D3C73_278440 [compost metagenome]